MAKKCIKDIYIRFYQMRHRAIKRFKQDGLDSVEYNA